jgi:hypothetical protein
MASRGLGATIVARPDVVVDGACPVAALAVPSLAQCAAGKPFEDLAAESGFSADVRGRRGGHPAAGSELPVR